MSSTSFLLQEISRFLSRLILGELFLEEDLVVDQFDCMSLS